MKTPKTDNPKMAIKKANMSQVMKKAWQFRKAEKLNLSKALKRAWQWFKSQLRAGKISKIQMQLF